MCKFASGEDPEYEKVEGEISRHILRFRESMDTRRTRESVMMDRREVVLELI